MYRRYDEQYDNISLERMKSLVERLNFDMKRKEILSHHTSPIKQLPNGRWYTRLNGKKIERTSKDSLIDAVVRFYTQKQVTINYIFRDYLARRKETVAETTWKFDVLYYDKFVKESKFGNIPISKITLDDGYEFFNYCLSVKSDIRKKYWNNVRGFLNNVMQYCLDKNYISVNPITNLKPGKDLFKPKIKTKDCDTVFTKHEQSLVCERAKNDSIKTNSAIPLGIILLFNLGLRIGELCALKWGDIEIGRFGNYIHIQREQIYAVNEQGKVRGNRVVDHCKTDAGDRRLLLNHTADCILEEVRNINRSNKFGVGNDDFIFLRRKKGIVKTCTVRCFDPRLRRYCRDSGMTVIKSPHDIRRTVLTNLYFAGMPLKKIQEFAGHSTLQQTMDYIRISNDADEMMQYLNSLSNIGEHQ